MSKQHERYTPWELYFEWSAISYQLSANSSTNMNDKHKDVSDRSD
ncbi:MAG: hypothetical protein SAK29_34990 [Scytonema sp. PMC 1069.18]|nr:hypothetical protein [Scytonema sp. PMC 1069.18]MEC4886526.1 hypothetical protein [Scytonema sp. PMC 1070.18]